MIIFDASALVSAALKADSVPERALLRAEEVDAFALSPAVDGEIAGVLNRPRFARAIPPARRERVLEILRHAAVWFEPTARVTDCRDPKDNRYLELALAAPLTCVHGRVYVGSILGFWSVRQQRRALLMPMKGSGEWIWILNGMKKRE